VLGDRRVVVLGRGGAGKSTTANHLGQLTGLPVIELDKHSWSADLVPLGKDAWADLQDVAACAPQAELHLLRSPRRLRRFLASVAATHRRRPRT